MLYVNIIFSIFFFWFCVQNLCCNDSKYHFLNWGNVSVTNVAFFEKKQFGLQFYYSLLQVYIVYRVPFILVSVCTKGFAYLLCWPRGRRIRLPCTRIFSFYELHNFLLFNFFYFWEGELFFTHDIYPHPHPHPHQRPLPTTHDI